jgi:hypothetical protein
MPATVTLSTTYLVAGITAGQKDVRLASGAGLFPKVRLYVGGELMAVVSVGVTTSAYTAVEVQRGVDGTTASAHSSASVVTIGTADQFYSSDPVGSPEVSIPVSPYINATAGTVWFAQGDALEGAARWWSNVTTTYGIGALGVRTTASDPTSST